jgi:hypothetical protein
VRRGIALLYARPATPQEVELATRFLASAAPDDGQNKLSRWERFAQVLLGSNEFMYVD